MNVPRQDFNSTLLETREGISACGMTSFHRQLWRRLISCLLAFGTEGLAGPEARRVNAVTIGCVASVLAMPGYIVNNLVNGLPFSAIQVWITPVLMPSYIVPLLLVRYRQFTAAKLVALLLGNLNIVCWEAFNGYSVGTSYYAAVAGFWAFLLFSRKQWYLILLALLVPLLVDAFAREVFSSAMPRFALTPENLAATERLNFVSSYLVTCTVVLIFYAMVQTAERRLDVFARSVSEYLDEDLVDKLRENVDVGRSVRFLTVYFADLVGSTRLSFAMDQADFGNLLNDYVREMQAIIKTHGGFIEDISGDGIMGYLGNFETGGDKADARSAMRMSVAMQRRLAALTPVLRQRYGLAEPLRMRISLSSGLASVGKSTGARAIYTANGDIVNLGAKLEKGLAEHRPLGGIIVSEQTKLLLDDEFSFEQCEVNLNGTPIAAFIHQPTS
ncbi:MAG: adenylate/guanylate cyclase domain-containing protein [Gammaproteobacteria bacterium]|nr:adenylate/guanylate cyclase domain-containing protein [Gammaproteobacteria bacterium]